MKFSRVSTCAGGAPRSAAKVADEDVDEDPVMMMWLSMTKNGRSRSIGGGFVEVLRGVLGGGCGSRRSAAAARFF
jgi:hypothetical protein